MAETRTSVPRSPRASELVDASAYSLAWGGLRVEYATTAFTGRPVLTYQDPQRTLSFTGDEIRAVPVSDLGSIVSVTLVPATDAGPTTLGPVSTTFSLLVPRVLVPPHSGIAPADTIDVTTHHRPCTTPTVVGRGQQHFYTITLLRGEAIDTILLYFCRISR
jgi:hypothetical protein